jgi:hypothetical protein
MTALKNDALFRKTDIKARKMKHTNGASMGVLRIEYPLKTRLSNTATRVRRRTAWLPKRDMEYTLSENGIHLRRKSSNGRKIATPKTIQYGRKTIRSNPQCSKSD